MVWEKRANTRACGLMALGGVLLLAACGDDPAPPKLDVDLPAHFTAPAPRANDTPAPLTRDWWKAAHDPVLDALMERIETQNLSLEQARLRLTVARSTVAGTEYLPTVSLSQSTDFEPVSVFLQRNTLGGVPNKSRITSAFGGYHQIGLDAKWELPLFGRDDAAEALSKAEIGQAEADVTALRSAVYAEAVADYTGLRANQQRLATLRRIRAEQQEVAQLTRLRVEAALEDDRDALAQEQALRALDAELAQAESAVTEFREKLAHLEGTSKPDPALDMPGPFVAFPPMEFGDTPIDVMRNRPDLRHAEQAVIAAAAEAKLAQTDRYPRLTLQGSLFKFDNLLHHPAPDTGPAGSLAEGLVLPLFDWGHLRAAADAKNTKLAESASAYRDSVIGAITETEQMLGLYRATQAERQARKGALETATTLRDRNDTRNKQGLGNKIALREAEIAEQRAALGVVEATSNETVALTNVARALGGGLASTAGASREANQ